jgi:GR25 family glycosyltransferase involved in LPS biosynthesis
MNNFLLDTFKEIYVINLDRRQDRYESFKERLKNEGINPKVVKRFSAVDGKKMEKIENKNMSEIACFISHYNIWKKVRENKKLKEEDLIWIMEDDIQFNESFKKYFQFIMKDFKETSKGPKFLHIGGRWVRDFYPLNNLEKFQVFKNNLYIRDNELCQRLNNPWHYDRTTHSIILNKGSCIELCKICEKENSVYNLPVDSFLNVININNNEIKFYECLPHLVWAEDGNDTDIQSINFKTDKIPDLTFKL